MKQQQPGNGERMRRVSQWLAAGILPVIAVAMYYGFASHKARDRTLLESLATTLEDESCSPFLPRFVVVGALRPCRRGEQPSLRLRTLTSRILTTANPAMPGDARAAAIANVLHGNVERAIALLQPFNRDADALSDLAAIHLIAAQQSGDVLSSIDALGAAEGAQLIRPAHSAARTNRAMALEELGLIAEARVAWCDAALEENDSHWSDLALGRLSALNREVASVRSWASDRQMLEASVRVGDATPIVGYIRRHPRDARAWAESVYTTEWAEAYLRGDAAKAAQRLAIARAIGDGLRVASGEYLVSDAVKTIVHSDAASRSLLARAYVQYRAGRLAHNMRLPHEAERRLLEAQTIFDRTGSPMRYVARYYRGSSLYARDEVRAAQSVLDELAAEPLREKHYYALSAEIGWERGLCRFVSGSFSEALEIFQQSRAVFERLGERDMAATFSEFAADTYDYTGDPSRAWRLRVAALHTFTIGGLRARTQTAVSSAARAMIIRGEWTRALPLLNIVVKHSTRDVADAIRACEALVQRSRVLLALARPDEAARDLTAMRPWCAEIPDDAARRQLESERDLIEGLALRVRNPRAAVKRFNAAIAAFQRSGRTFFLARSYVERSRVQKSLGLVDNARRDLYRGIDLIEQERISLRDIEHRAMSFAAARELFNDAIALALDRGRDEEAFDLAERARGRSLLDYVSRHGSESFAPRGAATIRESLANDAAVVQYIVLSDRVQAVVLRRSDLQSIRLPASAAAIEGAINGNDVTLMERFLFDPLLRSLEGVHYVVAVPDPILSRVPFARLQLRLHDGAVVVAPSATLGMICSERAVRRAAGPVVVVSGDRFDRSAVPELRRLELTVREARAVAAVYGNSIMLYGDVATRSAFIAAARDALIVHFCGHVVEDRLQPLNSALLLAPDHGVGALTAADVTKLRLRNVPLVFLSSCRGAATGRRGDGIENLATAFLMAGAVTVIASTSDVPDDVAARLATRFHQLYAASRDAAGAFRQLARDENIAGNPSNVMGLFGGVPELIREGVVK